MYVDLHIYIYIYTCTSLPLSPLDIQPLAQVFPASGAVYKRCLGDLGRSLHQGASRVKDAIKNSACLAPDR